LLADVKVAIHGEFAVLDPRQSRSAIGDATRPPLRPCDSWRTCL